MLSQKESLILDNMSGTFVMYIRDVCCPALGISEGLGRLEKKRLDASGDVNEVLGVDDVIDCPFVLGEVSGDL